MKIFAKTIMALLAVSVLIFGVLFSQIVLAQSESDETEQETGVDTKDDETSSESQLPYKYYGNSFSLKFHRPSCPFAEAISKRHLVLFHFRHEAIKAYYKPCRYCLPPVWWTVHGVLLPKTSKESPETETEANNKAEKQNDSDNQQKQQSQLAQ